jgi:LysM repeat protein
VPPGADSRRRVAHYAAPVVFLAAVTVLVLLIRAGLEGGSTAPTTAVAPTTTRIVSTAPRRTSTTAVRTYTVQTGDTFNSIAAKTGVPVSQLERLNPAVSSNSLQIGQKLRVK